MWTYLALILLTSPADTEPPALTLFDFRLELKKIERTDSGLVCTLILKNQKNDDRRTMWYRHYNQLKTSIFDEEGTEIIADSVQIGAGGYPGNSFQSTIIAPRIPIKMVVTFKGAPTGKLTRLQLPFKALDVGELATFRFDDPVVSE